MNDHVNPAVAGPKAVFIISRPAKAWTHVRPPEVPLENWAVWFMPNPGEYCVIVNTPNYWDASLALKRFQDDVWGAVHALSEAYEEPS
jgi:hypothetical protein